MQDHAVVSREDWLKARLELLDHEKEFTRARDALSAERRALPWVKIDKDYVFDVPDGQESLADLFDGRSQLLIYHFMYGPDWDEGCPSCSYWADGFNGFTIHLADRDVTMIAVSRAPLEKLEAYKKRLGWRFKWVSSFESDFNQDFEVSFSPEQLESGDMRYNYAARSFPSEEAPGISVFFKNDAGEVFHTYSCYARGLDMMNAAYHHLDLVPKGRDEDGLPYSMAWVRRNDSYED